MPTSEIMSMVGDALRAMVIGVSGVFVVLAVFYGTIKLIMSTGKRQQETEE